MLVGYEGGREDKICNPKYLLGQIIRQYVLSSGQYYISLRAENLWKSISGKSIWDYTYRQYVKCENDIPVTVFEYTGNQNKPRGKRIISKGDGFVFRDIFHDEHMIPISLAVNRLIAEKDLNYENVRKVLDSMYICRLLKCEDRELPVKYKRPYDLQEVIKMYHAAGIEIIKRR